MASVRIRHASVRSGQPSRILFLRPEYAGKISASPISIGGTAWMQFAFLAEKFGEDFVKKFAAQQPRLFSSYNTVALSVARGETVFGVTSALNEYPLRTAQNAYRTSLPLRAIPSLPTSSRGIPDMRKSCGGTILASSRLPKPCVSPVMISAPEKRNSLASAEFDRTGRSSRREGTVNLSFAIFRGWRRRIRPRCYRRHFSSKSSSRHASPSNPKNPAVWPVQSHDFRRHQLS